MQYSCTVYITEKKYGEPNLNPPVFSCYSSYFIVPILACSVSIVFIVLKNENLQAKIRRIERELLSFNSFKIEEGSQFRFNISLPDRNFLDLVPHLKCNFPKCLRLVFSCPEYLENYITFI